MSLFPSIFSHSLCMESTSYVLSFRMVFFLPWDHGRAGFLTSAYVRIQSINQNLKGLLLLVLHTVVFFDNRQTALFFVLFFVLFVCISLRADRPQRTRLLPVSPTAILSSCLWSLRIFPSLTGSRLTNFIAMQVQHSYISSSVWLNITSYSIKFSRF